MFSFLLIEAILVNLFWSPCFKRNNIFLVHSGSALVVCHSVNKHFNRMYANYCILATLLGEMVTFGAVKCSTLSNTAVDFIIIANNHHHFTVLPSLHLCKEKIKKYEVNTQPLGNLMFFAAKIYKKICKNLSFALY